MTSRQASVVVGRVLAAADEASVVELLDDPLRFLSSPPPNAKRRDPRLSDAGERVRRSLLSLAAQACATERTLNSPAPSGPVDSDMSVLQPHVRNAMEAMQLLLETLRRLTEGTENA